MSMITIHQHPEWDIIKRWFDKRANGRFGHTETVKVESAISPEITKAAKQLAFAMGKSISKEFARVAERHTQDT